MAYTNESSFLVFKAKDTSANEEISTSLKTMLPFSFVGNAAAMHRFEDSLLGR
jgi:hypothetical protein